jgi:ferredoxin--NADP+ reductase
MSAFHREKVLSVRHWTDTLFSFTATRNSGFRFQNGQFAMIGLEVDGRPLLRAYSMASANHEEALEFFSIKVADGPLTSRLQKIKEGDTILVGRKATGTLITDNLIPGQRLLLLSTGTGLAPFASLIKDPEVYDDSRASCWCMVAGRFRSSPMANNWWRRSARTNFSGR